MSELPDRTEGDTLVNVPFNPRLVAAMDKLVQPGDTREQLLREAVDFYGQVYTYYGWDGGGLSLLEAEPPAGVDLQSATKVLKDNLPDFRSRGPVQEQVKLRINLDPNFLDDVLYAHAVTPNQAERNQLQTRKDLGIAVSSILNWAFAFYVARIELESQGYVFQYHSCAGEHPPEPLKPTYGKSGD